MSTNDRTRHDAPRRRAGPPRLPAALLVALGLLVACGESDFEGAFDSPSGGADDGDAGGGRPGEAPDSEEPTPAPLRLSTPVRSGSWLFLANPARGTVAKMAFVAGRPRIATIPVGVAVASLAALDESGRVAALDETGTQLLVLEAAPFGGDDTVVRVAVPRGSDTMTPVPETPWLVVWDDADDGSSGAGLSTVSLVRAEPGLRPMVWPVAVGAFPYDVKPTSNGEVLVFSSEGVSTFSPTALDGGSIAPPIRLDDIETSAVDGRVLVSRDGRVLMRLSPSRDAVLLDEASREHATQVSLPGLGSGLVLARERDRIFVSVPDADRVVGIDFAAWPEADPVTTEIAVQQGRRDLAVTDDASHLLLFRAGEPDAEIVDLTTEATTALPTPRAISNALVLPGEQVAVVLHSGDPSDAGYTLADFTRAYTKTFDTSAPVFSIAWAESAGVVLLLTSNDARGTLHMVERETLVGRTVELRNPPVALGALDAEGVAWVMESHPLGRISFVDIRTRDVSTVTGFELNSLIE